MAARALPRAHFALIERLTAINLLNGEAAVRGDAVTYVRTNLEFHRTLYLRAQTPAMLAMCETVWLQLGPTMRAVYARVKRREPPMHHRVILAALKAGMAARALPRAHFALIERLSAINQANMEAALKGDAVTYVRTNLEFHRTLYLRAQTPAMLAMCETVWLQLGPTMRAVYARLKRREAPTHHRVILAALKAGDEPGLRLAVRTDVTQGLRHLTG
jgi:DNA-binding GntR family transcriptional regulator